jgi:hypothetical protein
MLEKQLTPHAAATDNKDSGQAAALPSTLPSKLP